MLRVYSPPSRHFFSILSEDYIIIDDTNSDPDDSDDDYVDEAGADIMESSTDQTF